MMGVMMGDVVVSQDIFDFKVESYKMRLMISINNELTCSLWIDRVLIKLPLNKLLVFM